MHRLTVALLGEPQLRLGNVAVSCSSRKALGLFCHVALSQKTQFRADLAQMFWGRADPEAARASLRTALLRLPKPLAEALRVDRHSVSPGDAIELDTERFVRLAGSHEAEALTEAAQLYRGELLKGLEVDATPEFDDWLARERSRYRQLAQSVFDRLIEHHRRRAGHDAAHAAVEREAAMATARRWCELEPAAESAHRWLIRLYLDTGRGDAALEQFEICKRELAVALGRSPSAETRALIDTLQRPAGEPARGALSASFATGQPGTSFVGRVDEIAELEQLLSEPNCRLLTLQALGGTGKSRLASVLADHLAPRFAQGVIWVPLEAVTSRSQVPLAIAQAMGVELSARAAPAEALCRVLGSQACLLVLDNLEHLLDRDKTRGEDVPELILRILREAPDVRFLVTSREVIGVQEEWLYELRGLQFPDSDETLFGRGSHSSVELFVQRARQAYAGFSAQGEWPHIVRLVRLVEGLPLAIELAAAWVRTIPCADLVGVIEAEMRALAARHRNRPARHSSLDAVVRTSWSLLSAEQQRALPPLALFVGGFTQEAAAEVADAPLRMMSSLVDKSLVRRQPDGRMGLHELVRQFALSQLESRAAEARMARRRFMEYFARFLEHCRAGIDTPQDLEAEAALTADMANLMAASEQWIDDSAMDATAEPLLRALAGRGQSRLLITYADRLLAREPRLSDAVRAYVLNWRAHASMAMGRHDACLVDIDEAGTLAHARHLDHPLAVVLTTRAIAGFHRDDFDDVVRTLDQLDVVVDRLRDPVLKLRAHYLRALVYDGRGESLLAAEALRKVLDRSSGVGSPLFSAMIRSSLAIPLLRQGHVEESEALLKAALPVIERARKAPLLGRSLITLTTAMLWNPGAPNPEGARVHAARASEIFEHAGNPYGVAVAADALGMALQACGRNDEAALQFMRAASSGLPTVESDGKFHLAMLCVARREAPQARRLAHELLEIARQHQLDGTRRCAALVAAAECVARAGSADAVAWLKSLLSDPALEYELRLHAERMLASHADASAAARVLPLDVLHAEVAAYLANND